MNILITGANRGIGRALFDSYSSAGDHVTGTTRGTPAPGGAWAQLDVTAEDAADRLRSALGDAGLDLLVCNAGVYLDKGQPADTGYAPEIWADTFAANVTGVFRTVQALLPNLQAADRAKIAIVSSIMASDAGAPGGSYIYRASKAAALNLGRNLAVDLKPRGIAVGIYHPGWVRTDMGGSAADVAVEDAAAGLVARFAALDLDSTGCFETFDGKPIPF